MGRVDLSADYEDCERSDEASCRLARRSGCVRSN